LNANFTLFSNFYQTVGTVMFDNIIVLIR